MWTIGRCGFGRPWRYCSCGEAAKSSGADAGGEAAEGVSGFISGYESYPGVKDVMTARVSLSESVRLAVSQGDLSGKPTPPDATAP